MSLPSGSKSFDDSMDLFDDAEEDDDTNAIDEDAGTEMKSCPNEQRSNETTVISFQCPFCNEFKSDELSVHMHIQSSHLEDNSPTAQVGTSVDFHLAGGNKKMNDILGTDETETFVCPYCCASHKMKESLAEHLTLIHGEELERKDLEEIIRSLGLLLCPLCVSICPSATEIQQHIDTQHSSRKEPRQSHSGHAASASATVSAGNSLVTVCPVCGLDEPDSDLLVSHIELHFDSSSGSADYQAPTVPSTSKKSGAGHASSSSSSSSISSKPPSSSSSSMSSETKGRDKKKRNGYHYKHQYRQELEKAVVKGKMSPGDYHEHVAQMLDKDMNGVDDGHSKVEGLIEQVQSFFDRRSREGQSVVLCGPTDYYCGSYGDRGWGCGYRNFQMMLSSLSRLHAYSHHFSKDGRIGIPSVSKIQEMIELAWQRGFDREGCLQLNSKVVNTRKWIGATEIVATLSSMGIRCELVDFPHPSSPDGTHPRLLQWVKDYFYKNQNAKPPLYLQHQGHSRTIVGVEVDKATTRLILFDPGSSKEHVASLRNNQMNWKQMGSFRRNVTAFKAKQYQIVAVVGILNKDEYERSKRLTSTRVL